MGTARLYQGCAVPLFSCLASVRFHLREQLVARRVQAFEVLRLHALYDRVHSCFHLRLGAVNLKSCSSGAASLNATAAARNATRKD